MSFSDATMALATTAWQAMNPPAPSILDDMFGTVRDPMPVDIAIDYVMEETGERETAAMAIMQMAVKELKKTLPPLPNGRLAEPHRHAQMAFMDLELWASNPGRFLISPQWALSHLGQIDRYTEFPDPRECPLGLLNELRLWANRAWRTARTCQEIWASTKLVGDKT